MVFKRVVGPVSGEAISTAMDAANCVGGFQSMATADVSEPRQAGKYLNDAMGTVMACTGKVFMNLAKGKLLDVFAVSVAQVFSWLWGGIQAFANGLGAIADTVLNLNGYTVTIWYRGQFSTPATPPSGVDHMPLPATVTYSGTAEDAKFSFQHPLEWTVTGPGDSLKMLNAQGEEMATLSVFAVWDAIGGMKERPVTKLPSTPGQVPLSGTGVFVVRNLAMDLRPYPVELGMIKWPKPVLLCMSMSDPAEPPKEMAPFLLYGLAHVETGKPAYGRGETDRLVLFNSNKYFDTSDQVTAYTKTDEYRKIQTMLASFKG